MSDNSPAPASLPEIIDLRAIADLGDRCVCALQSLIHPNLLRKPLGRGSKPRPDWTAIELCDIVTLFDYRTNDPASKPKAPIFQRGDDLETET